MEKLKNYQNPRTEVLALDNWIVLCNSGGYAGLFEENEFEELNYQNN